MFDGGSQKVENSLPVRSFSSVAGRIKTGKWADGKRGPQMEQIQALMSLRGDLAHRCQLMVYNKKAINTIHACII